MAFGVWLHSVPIDAAITHSVLYLHKLYSTLALKLFRGEPAIAKFDWNFSACHNSSAGVSTNVGSVLHWVVPQLQPDHGKITWLRVYVIILDALLRLAFASAPYLLLNLAWQHNSPVHSSIGTPSAFNGLWLFVSIQFQILFTPLPGFFSPFPHGTGSLSVTS